MIEAILIIGFSLVLFVYWFRYTVVLMLSEDQVEAQDSVASLNMLETHRTLRNDEEDLPLDRLHGAVEKDYRVLCYLMDHAADLGQRPLERFLLILDYRLLRIWYHLTRNSSASQARRALQEMADILTHIAYKMGERAGSPSRA